jgi:hypothetical protein
MSKAMLVTASRVSAGPHPTTASMPLKKLITAAWGTTTPFGRPVDPEV